jgi:hypothetical protein
MFERVDHRRSCLLLDCSARRHFAGIRRPNALRKSFALNRAVHVIGIAQDNAQHLARDVVGLVVRCQREGGCEPA